MLRATVLVCCVCAALQLAAGSEASSSGDSTWAVLVCTSRYWFNYRHFANVLAVYKEVRALGVPDERILLMSSLDAAMDPRNPFPGEMYSTNSAKEMRAGRSLLRERYRNSSGATDYPSSRQRSSSSSSSSSESEATGVHSFHQLGDVQVDYLGLACSSSSLLRLLTGRHPAGTPLGQQLRSGPRSRVLLYLTGHGGNEFLKFHDQEELSAADLAAAIRQMWLQRRYGELLLIIDTCQASTLGNYLQDAPGVTFIGSSGPGENSFAYDTNHELGLAVVDRFTHKLQQYLHKYRDAHLAHLQKKTCPGTSTGAGTGNGNGNGNAAAAGSASAGAAPSVQDFVNFLRQREQRHFMHSTASLQQSAGARRAHSMVLADFFGGTGTGCPHDRNHDDHDRGRGDDTDTDAGRGSADGEGEGEGESGEGEATWGAALGWPAASFTEY